MPNSPKEFSHILFSSELNTISGFAGKVSQLFSFNSNSNWPENHPAYPTVMTDDIDAKILREKDPKKLIPPLHGALLKNEQDVHLFERLAFISRRESENIE